MAAGLKKLQNTTDRKQRLSTAGKVLLAVLALACVVAIIHVVSCSVKSIKEKVLAQPVYDTVEHSILVCQGIMGKEALSDYIKEIKLAETVQGKVEAAQAMLAYVSRQNIANRSRRDELSEASNRITEAYEAYQEQKSVR